MKVLARLFTWFAAAAVLAVVVLGFQFVRFVVREHSDSEPCPSCRHEAFIKGQPLVDEKERPLRFTNGSTALQYERVYAQPAEAAEKTTVPASRPSDGGRH